MLQLAVIYIPVLNTAFGTTPLHWHQWFEAIALAACVLAASELYKLAVRVFSKNFSKKGQVLL